MPRHTYTVVYEQDEETGDVTATFPALDLATQARTIDDARAMAREALHLHLEGMIEDGDPLPADVVDVEEISVDVPEPKAVSR